MGFKKLWIYWIVIKNTCPKLLIVEFFIFRYKKKKKKYTCEYTPTL